MIKYYVMCQIHTILSPTNVEIVSQLNQCCNKSHKKLKVDNYYVLYTIIIYIYYGYYYMQLVKLHFYDKKL